MKQMILSAIIVEQNTYHSLYDFQSIMDIIDGKIMAAG